MPPSAANVTARSSAPTSSPVNDRRGSEGLAGRSLAGNGERLTRTNPDPTPDEPPEVLGLHQRPVTAGRGDLHRIGLAQVFQMMGDLRAEIQRDTVGVVDEDTEGSPSDDLGQKHLDGGLGGLQTGFDGVLNGGGHSGFSHKKAGSVPTSTGCCGAAS